MKKLNFSKKNILKKIDKIKNFFKEHYIVFFQKVPLLFCFVITSLLNTLLLRIITIGNFTYLKPLFMDLGMILIFSSLMFLFKKEKSQKKYLVGLSIFTTIVLIIHSVYYTYYDSFASISLLATSAFVVDVGDAVVKKVLKLTDLLYLWQPVFVYFYYMKEKKKNLNSKKNINPVDRKFSFINLFVTGILVLILTGFTVTPTEWSRFGKMWNRESVVSSFGVYTYQINDIFQSLEPKINNLFGHDKALKKVTDYYSSNSSSDSESKNEYSNIFEGKNVIKK